MSLAQNDLPRKVSFLMMTTMMMVMMMTMTMTMTMMVTMTVMMMMIYSGFGTHTSAGSKQNNPQRKGNFVISYLYHILKLDDLLDSSPFFTWMYLPRKAKWVMPIVITL